MGDEIVPIGDDSGDDGKQDAAPSQIGPLAQFHPQSDPLVANLDYRQFMDIRIKILNVIRSDDAKTQEIASDIVDAVLGYEKGIPCDATSVFHALRNLSKSVRDQHKERAAFTKATQCLLEQIFDPGLEFKMTKKDILDVLEASGYDRHKVSDDHVRKMYVQVLAQLKTGHLRDLTYETLFHHYVRLKIYEITVSRQDWELNQR